MPPDIYYTHSITLNFLQILLFSSFSVTAVDAQAIFR